MGYKSRSNYAIGQKVSDELWDSWFSKEPQKEDSICESCKSPFIPEYHHDGCTNCTICSCKS